MEPEEELFREEPKWEGTRSAAMLDSGETGQDFVDCSDQLVEMEEDKPPPTLSEEEGFDNKSVLADEQFTQERYDEIKAKTMHQMIEDIDGKQQLLFLTNHQAELLAQPDNVAKLFGALEINHTPKLLIVLQWDGLFQRHMAAQGPSNTGDCINQHERKNGPFVSGAESREAEARLDRFMLEVLIPIAVQTNAVVICDAVSEVELSSSFLRMVAVQRASFADKLPFYVIAMTDSIHRFYANPNPHCHWRSVRRLSRAWAKRDKKLVDLLVKPERKKGARYDINPGAPMLIVTDCIDAKRDQAEERGPATRLLTSMIRHLTVTLCLPSIAFRTGTGWANELDDESAGSLLRAVDALNSGCPVVFLDVRKREVCSSATRQEIIDKAKKGYTQLCADLEDVGTMEWFNVCALAWFHDVLFGDGDTRTTGTSVRVDNAGGGPQALHEALRFLRLRERQSSDDPALNQGRNQGLGPATREQVIDVAQFLAERWFSGYNAKLAKTKSEQEMDKLCERQITQQNPMVHIYSMLLSHEMFNGANAADLDGVRRLVQTLVKLDRLPKANTLEALELLQQAWNKHDVAVYLSGQYLLLAKALYAVILLIGVATVTCTAVFADPGVIREMALIDDYRKYLIFSLSMANTVLLLAVKFFNPAVRGNQLRASADTLESIIWQFRARIGPFAVPHNSMLSQSSEPTKALRVAMVSWHARVVGGTDLLQTSLEREYPDKVYIHCQYKGTLDQLYEFHEAAKVDREISALTRKLTARAHSHTLNVIRPPSGEVGASSSEDVLAPRCDEREEDLLQKQRDLESKQRDLSFFVNDHHSPVRPAEYLQLRLLVARQKYQRKIPQCYAWRRFWELVLTVCTIASSTLSCIGTTAQWVSVSSAMATAVTSWVSHEELSRRIQLHSNAVRCIDDLIWWWRSLDDAERANTANITQLIQIGESILATERLSWIPASQGEDNDSDRGSSGGNSRTADMRSENATGIGGPLGSGGGMKRGRVAPDS